MTEKVSSELEKNDKDMLWKNIISEQNWIVISGQNMKYHTRRNFP